MNTICNPCTDHPLTITPRLMPFDIIIRACKYLRVETTQITGKRRDRHIVEARQMIADMLYADKYLNLSLKNIGRELGDRDHSTIIHSIDIVKKLCSAYPDYRQKYIDVHNFVYGSTKYFNY